MKARSVTVLSGLMLFFTALPNAVRAEEGAYQAMVRQLQEQQAKAAAEKSVKVSSLVFNIM